MHKQTTKKVFLFLFLILFHIESKAERTIVLKDEISQYDVSYNYIEILEDKTALLSLKQVINLSNLGKFQSNKIQLPRNKNLKSAYWLKFKIKNYANSDKKWLLEYYDSSIENIELFVPNAKGGFKKFVSGNSKLFENKIVSHKNFVFLLPDLDTEEQTFYVRIYSAHTIFMFSVLRNYQRFSFYALNEYYFLGIFYGIIIAIALYNFFMLISVKDRAYLFYVFYVLFNGLYSMSLDGTGFQYLWPNLPDYNQIIGTGARFGMIISVLFYSASFLKLNEFSSGFNILKQIVVLVYLVLFILQITILPGLKQYISLDVIPLVICFAAGFRVLNKGFVAARYFLMGFTFLLAGFIVSNLTVNSLMGLSLPNNIFTVYSINFGTFIQLMFQSFALADRFKMMKRDTEIAQNQLILQLKEKDELKEKVNKELEKKVKERTFEIETQNYEILLQKKEIQDQSEKIEYLYKEVTDSISTAKLIQQSILPAEHVIKSFLPDSFVFYRPKDVVSGDFYWFYVKGDSIIIAAVDCTGHGVAGAFMSLIGYNLLNQVTKERTTLTAADILNKLNADLIRSLNQDKEGATSRDGMDIAICIISTTKKTIQYAGANNPLYLIRNNELQIIKADKYSIGIQHNNKVAIFLNNIINYEAGDCLYIFSDGFPGQFGGENGEDKFMYHRFKDMLLKNSRFPMSEQNINISNEFDNWKGNYEQIDDILLIGFRM